MDYSYTTWTDFRDFLPLPPPSWTLLLYKAYEVEWSFGYTLPLNYPRGLWMPPYEDQRSIEYPLNQIYPLFLI